MARKLDFDGEFDYFVTNRKRRYSNVIGMNPDVKAPIVAPTLSANIGSSATAVNGGIATGIVGSGSGSAVGGTGINSPAMPASSNVIASPTTNPIVAPTLSANIGSNYTLTTPTPTPTPTPTTPTPANTPTFTEGILIGSGLLGANLQNATTPRYSGGGADEEAGDPNEEVVQPTKLRVANTTNYNKNYKTLIIGSLIVGAIYLIYKSK